MTPLHWAAKRGHEKIIEALLEYGAKADQADIVNFFIIVFFYLFWEFLPTHFYLIII